ncbi:MAG: serine/threonine-protein kinase [Nannocystaceae bacterium]
MATGLEDTEELLQTGADGEDALAGAATVVAEEDEGGLGGFLASAGTLPFGDTDRSVAAELGDSGAVRRTILPPGTLIGRYRLLTPLGAGGMGVVYRALDPELDRQVAIKILRQDRRAARDAARFTREAQAMAKVSHPNVVPIHDVGECEAGLFLAMELVEGTTLRRWLQAQLRGWREVVEICVQAGRGLAEAHAAGMIHRDFKPENVLVDRRGRARVTDFGLARAEAPEAPPDRYGRLAALAIGSSGITRSGTIMGTPAYMAPEQLAGRKVDARADLFAFCVVLHEALFGAVPFAGGTVGERLAVIHAGRILEIPRRGAPRWLTRAVLRGLAHDPDARWSSMSELLAVLERGLGRRRRSLWGALVAAPLVAVAGGLALAGGDPGTCTGDDGLAEVWSEGPAAAVAAAIRGTGLHYAEETWSKVHVLLDSYVGSWRDLRRRSCEEHRGGAISGDLLDRRATCLEQRRADLGLVVDALREGDDATTERAVELVTGLGAIDRCRDPAAAPAVSEAHREWAESVRLRLARGRLLARTARHVEALELADALQTEVDAMGDEALSIEATELRGRILSDRGEHGEAEALYVGAFERAYAGGFDALATEAASQLIFVSGEGRARYAAGEAWARVALAGARRTDDVQAEATTRHWYGVMLSSADRTDEALVELRRAHALRSRIFGEEALETSGSATALGNVLWKSGRLEEAITFQQASLRSRAATLGEHHPGLIVPLGNLGVALDAIGRRDEARSAWERSLELIVTTYGRGHPNAAVMLANLGSLEVNVGNLDRAAAHMQEAIELARASLGEHPDTALMLHNYGDLLARKGDLDGADAALGESLKITAATVGVDHSNAGMIERSIGDLRRRQGRLEEARERWAKALEVLSRALGAEHPRVADVLLSRAEEARARGDFTAALAELERARAIYFASEEGPASRGAALFALARASIEAGRDRAAAEAWVAEARALAVEAGSPGAPLIVEIDAWRADAGPEG